MSRELRQRGFNFVGSTICCSFMQAVGMVNDHVVRCFRHGEVMRMAKKKQDHSDGSMRVPALVVATLANFLTPFMGSAVNIALPAIGAEFAADVIVLSWDLHVISCWQRPCSPFPSAGSQISTA